MARLSRGWQSSACVGSAILDDFEADEDGNVYLSAPSHVRRANRSFAALQQIYARLRRPDGCPWDREQSELTTVPHIVEEADELR